MLQECKNFTLHYFLEYKKKLYSFQEDAEQLEGFQTQEMAKVKHLVCFIKIIYKPLVIKIFLFKILYTNTYN